MFGLSFSAVCSGVRGSRTERDDGENGGGEKRRDIYNSAYERVSLSQRPRILGRKFQVGGGFFYFNAQRENGPDELN